MVAVAQHVPMCMDRGYTMSSNQKDGFINFEVKRRHSQLEAHLYERVATLVATLRALQDTAETIGVPGSLAAGKPQGDEGPSRGARQEGSDVGEGEG